MGKFISERAYILERANLMFLGPWCDVRDKASQQAIEECKNSQDWSKIDDLLTKYIQKLDDELNANFIKQFELVNKFIIQLFRLNRLDAVSMNHHYDVFSTRTKDYHALMSIEFIMASRNYLWFEKEGAYMLMNGLTLEQMENVALNDLQTPANMLTALARKFSCAIEYEVQCEAAYASREVFMFDESKVFDEFTTYDVEDGEAVPTNLDFKKKPFKDIVKENIEKALDNLNLKTAGGCRTFPRRFCPSARQTLKNG